jgi:hypothetical protein
MAASIASYSLYCVPCSFIEAAIAASICSYSLCCSDYCIAASIAASSGFGYSRLAYRASASSGSIEGSSAV